MKKILTLAAAALVMSTALIAQGDVYKQTGGERNLEFLFAPLGGSPIGINGIKYRTFTSATTAYRGEVFVGFNSSTDISVAGPNNTELKDTDSDFSISIAPGIERHFAGTDRLSPYVGGVLVLGFNSMSNTAEGLDVDNNVQEVKTTDGSLTLGANAVAGMDFYFADNIYVGAELGFGLLFTSDFDTKVEAPGGDADSPNGSSFGIGPNAVGAIRLGFLF